MDFDLRTATEAARRWEQRGETREPKLEKLRAGRGVEVESPARVQKRMERLAAAAKSRAAVGLRPPAAAAILLEKIGFERVLGKSDFHDINFIELALAVSRFVGRINIRRGPGRTAGFGTGFMVSPSLLLTNHHVLGARQEAAHSEVEFDYQHDRFGRLLPVVVYGLDPAAFFVTSEELDYTLVAVREQSVNGIALRQYGWNRLIPDQGKAILGEALNIIQHPKGEPKQIVLRSNQLLDLPDHFAHYTSDTEPGSSGSPVFNDQWEVVALHHSGVPRMKDGDLISKDGSVWRPGMDPDDLDWVANEGIRVSSLVEHLKKQTLSPAQGKLREDLLNLEPPHPMEIIPEPDQGARVSVHGSGSAGSSGAAVPAITEPGVYTWEIPLRISVSIGTPAVSDSRYAPPPTAAAAGADVENGAPQPDAGAPTTEPADPDLSAALAELEAAAAKKYYDQERDEAARDEYYQGVSADVGPAKFYAALSELLTETHRNRPAYRPAVHVYPWVDLREATPKLVIKSVYSGKSFDPQELIEEDFRTEGRRLRLAEGFAREGAFAGVAERVQLDLLEASLPFNCEHVVPQSWFDKREPMRGDLHHLFACEVGCNSFRGNIPYFNFPDFEEVIREDCGKRETGKFEPSFGKGAVARATLYFLLRYPGQINRTSQEYTADRIGTLLHWHRQFPPDRYEKHRNAAIFEKQGNRNPLIDFPDWAEAVDFTRGLGA